jgi:hypothetical protein
MSQHHEVLPHAEWLEARKQFLATTQLAVRPRADTYLNDQFAEMNLSM